MIVAPRALHQINPLPHSLNVGVSLGVDHEAPVYVLLDGVEPPELPGHNHEDGGDIDQNQALSQIVIIVYNLYNLSKYSPTQTPSPHLFPPQTRNTSSLDDLGPECRSVLPN